MMVCLVVRLRANGGWHQLRNLPRVAQKQTKHAGARTSSRRLTAYRSIFPVSIRHGSVISAWQWVLCSLFLCCVLCLAVRFALSPVLRCSLFPNKSCHNIYKKHHCALLRCSTQQGSRQEQHPEKQACTTAVIKHYNSIVVVIITHRSIIKRGTRKCRNTAS